MIEPLDAFYFRQLNEANSSCQRGFYFDTIITSVSGLTFALSNLITDSYWNYAYNSSGLPAAALRDELIDGFAAYQRIPALLLPENERRGDADFNRLFQPSNDRSAWMIADEHNLPASAASPHLRIVPVDNARTIGDAERVFADACTSPDDDGVGYTSLPPEYNTALYCGLAQAKDFGSDHLIGYEENVPVALASAHYSGGLAGIYNVAVSRAARRRGYGMAISRAILSLAARKAQRVFLSTEADSPVEAMYAKVGFKTVVRAQMWHLISDP